MQNELEQYYDKIIPVQDLFRWLSHSATPTLDFTHRELAMVLPNDAYIRYLSYPSSDAFKRDLKRLQPSRFEIGPVYTHEPKLRKAVPADTFRPLSKELVFDIDLTDYDNVRTCCQEANVCLKCWQFMNVAIECMERALRQDFGFEHILWVFSGRRGVHAWVCDQKARDLNDQQRKAIIGYLSYKGLNPPFHPHLEASYEICIRNFNSIILNDQNLYQGDRAQALKEKFPPKVRDEIDWDEKDDSTTKWKKLQATIASQPAEVKKSAQLTIAKEILECLYPRLDENVSKALNHLLKSPFCVHPKTDLVCVPLDMSDYKSFNPLEAPKLSKVEEEMASVGNASKTELGPYLAIFNKFVTVLMRSEKRPSNSLDF